MIYLKSILAGVAGGILAVLLSALLVGLVAFAWVLFEMRRQASGGIGAVSAGFAESFVLIGLLLGLLGFAGGFWCEFRRASR